MGKVKKHSMLALRGQPAQTFIKHANVQINLDAKSKPGGQNGLIWNKDKIFYQIENFLMPIHLQIILNSFNKMYSKP